jgi:hypothetical protein
MIDNVDSLLVDCYQNGNIFLLEKTHKTSNWLLHLAVEEGSTVCVCLTLMLFLVQWRMAEGEGEEGSTRENNNKREI